MPRDSDVVPVMEVAAIIEALHEHLLTVLTCTVLGQPHLLELSVALTIIGLNLSASVGDTVNFLYLVGVCNGSYSTSSGLALTICL